MRKNKVELTITDVLKTAIEESGLSQYRISRDTGVPATSIMRFARGETSLRLDNADVLADYFGLQLTQRPD